MNARFPGTMTLTMAAGIDMPNLAVAAAFGQALPDSINFRELAVVRHWTDVTVEVSEYGRIAPLVPEVVS